MSLVTHLQFSRILVRRNAHWSWSGVFLESFRNVPRTNQILLFAIVETSLVHHRVTPVIVPFDWASSSESRRRFPGFAFLAALRHDTEHKSSETAQLSILYFFFIGWSHHKKTCRLHSFLEYLPVMIISFLCFYTHTCTLINVR